MYLAWCYCPLTLYFSVLARTRSSFLGKVNTATMAVVQHLQEAMHYPVSNTELIQASKELRVCYYCRRATYGDAGKALCRNGIPV